MFFFTKLRSKLIKYFFYTINLLQDERCNYFEYYWIISIEIPSTLPDRWKPISSYDNAGSHILKTTIERTWGMEIWNFAIPFLFSISYSWIPMLEEFVDPKDFDNFYKSEIIKQSVYRYWENIYTYPYSLMKCFPMRFYISFPYYQIFLIMLKYY